jgi:hypothetical protein
MRRTFSVERVVIERVVARAQDDARAEVRVGDD